MRMSRSRRPAVVRAISCLQTWENNPFSAETEVAKKQRPRPGFLSGKAWSVPMLCEAVPVCAVRSRRRVRPLLSVFTQQTQRREKLENKTKTGSKIIKSMTRICFDGNHRRRFRVFRGSCQIQFASDLLWHAALVLPYNRGKSTDSLKM